MVARRQNSQARQTTPQFHQEAIDIVLESRISRFTKSAQQSHHAIFAILGNETMLGRAANVPAATGARRPVVLGKIVPADVAPEPGGTTGDSTRD